LTLLAPRILRWLVDISKSFVPLTGRLGIVGR
jgi:hypothetical protein